ncbi:MAG: hypothetical protein DMG70_27865 [Acidobacteria bacterium]|nr:MAG: hypothetical protein DMG70_27865 [Acidobacteriota bacterium]
MRPESTADFWQVGFVQKSAVARRLQVDAPDLNIQCVFLRRDYEVGTVAAQLTIAVATATPKVMATPASTLRRFCRRNDS